MPYSIAFFKFRKSLERDIRSYWTIAVATELSNTFLQQFDQDRRITQVARNVRPFTQVDIPCRVFITHLPIVVEHSRENALVNFITAFEVYLFEILARITYIIPDTLETSDMKFDAKDIVAGLKSKDFKNWFSNKSTDKTVRNKQHFEIVQKISRLTKCDIAPIQNAIDEWNKWTYVRNAIVHNGRRISNDLYIIWRTRFSNVGEPLNIQENEIMRIQSIANQIAMVLDQKAIEVVIGNKDAFLLLRELFIRNGIDDHVALRRIIHRNLRNRISRQNVDQLLAFQRRTNTPITEVDFEAIVNDLIMD